MAAAQQPNILLLIADDYGVDQSRLYTETAAAPTPNIAALAQRGVTFDHLWASSSCSPTRATLLSGQIGFRNGVSWVIASGAPGIGMDDRLDTPHYLPKLLNAQGYDTGLIGKWHLSRTNPDDPIQAGFDFWTGTLRSFGSGLGAPADSVAAYWNTNLAVNRCEDGTCETINFPEPPFAWPVPAEFHQNYKTTWEVDRALEWIGQRDNPWFLWLAFQSPHVPLQLPPEALVDANLVAEVKDELGDYEAGYWAKMREDPEIAKIVYHAMVSALDTEIGRLLDSIDLSNTWVIFFGDNGTVASLAEPNVVPPGHGKGSEFEGGINVPFVVAGPGITSAGWRSPVLTTVPDIYSTVLTMAGADVDDQGHPVTATRHAQIDGRSLLSVITEGAQNVYGREYVVNNSHMFPHTNPVLARGQGFVPVGDTEVIREQQYKLHRNTLMNDVTGFSCVEDPQPSTDNPLACDVTGRVKSFALYDMIADPLETNDLLAGGAENLTEAQRAAYIRLRKALTENTY